MISGFLVQAEYCNVDNSIISSEAYKYPGDATKAYAKLINEFREMGFDPYYTEEYTTYDDEYPCCYLTRDDGVENRVKVFKLPIKIK